MIVNFDTENSDKQQIIHIISSEKTPQPTPSLSNTNNTEQPNATIVPGDNYSYVQLTAVHEYNYPVVDEPVGAVMNARRGSTCSLKKRSALDMAEQHIIKEPTLHKTRVRCRYGMLLFYFLLNISKKKRKKKQKAKSRLLTSIPHCTYRYCQEFYTEEWNGKAAYCEFAPDCFKNGLEQISGMMCARCMLYHCMSDSEGDTTQHPCECVCENGCTRR